MRAVVRLRRRMHEELKGVGSSMRLAAQVAACVGKALRLLAEKAEYMAATGAPNRLRISLLPQLLTLFFFLSDIFQCLEI